MAPYSEYSYSIIYLKYTPQNYFSSSLGLCSCLCYLCQDPQDFIIAWLRAREGRASGHSGNRSLRQRNEALKQETPRELRGLVEVAERSPREPWCRGLTPCSVAILYRLQQSSSRSSRQSHSRRGRSMSVYTKKYIWRGSHG